ncbi:uncharacterized protein BYT42DRAFT_616405 [Radiomyces spectabilis]|uniref:uncharacterized protein n=1 Tax=Radiomyces spectabilis TaxID=64574 RepID=UPI00221EFF07|nr:uncharacterized protein BYT42DRAFT_616405 [Radiomyces spectabilis]KAI8373239.1 hypothetical protein BYT42DRAFT_616405 [Radiomyces spectabilis]
MSFSKPVADPNIYEQMFVGAVDPKNILEKRFWQMPQVRYNRNLGHQPICYELEKFRCPLADCQKAYANLETFRQHAARIHPGSNGTVAVDKEKEQPSKRQKANPVAFRKIDGCHAALKLGSSVRNANMANALECDPGALDLAYPGRTMPLRLMALANIVDLHSVCQAFPFNTPTSSLPLPCALQLPTRKASITSAVADPISGTDVVIKSSSADIAPKISRTVRRSWLPNLLAKMGHYAEVYARASGRIELRFPTPARTAAGGGVLITGAIVLIQSPYNALFVAGIFEEADDHGMENKLKFGLHHLRQVTSSFEDASTLAPWRAVVPQLDTEFTRPTTIFTLCDTPHNQGYGSSALSAEKLASRVLQHLALDILDDTTPDFSTSRGADSAAIEARQIKDADVMTARIKGCPRVERPLSSFLDSLSPQQYDLSPLPCCDAV